MTNFHLFQCRTTQPFRVAKGKSRWIFWNVGDNNPYNLREILENEIVIEFDEPKDFQGNLQDFQKISVSAVYYTAINLFKAGYSFEIWDHKGKSPHIHIRNLAIPKFNDKKQTKSFKEFFIKQFVPKEYHNLLDCSLCGTHLIALEDTPHWKNKYGIKKLWSKF